MSDNLAFGNVEVQCLTDAHATLPFPLTALFPTTTESDWDEFKQRYPSNFTESGQFHVHVGSYLIRSDGKTILVDTGLGPDPIEMMGGATGALPDELARHSIAPDDVDVVFHTHLHFDHVGWNTEQGKPRFKNARYICPAADWKFFQIPEVQEHFPPNSFEGPMKPIADAGQLDQISGEHALTSEVTAIPTPGHTPGHMSLLISSAGEKALVTGDTLASPAHITNPHWKFLFDADPDQAVTTRTGLIDRIEQEGLEIIACHLPSPGFGQILRLNGRRYWQAV